MKNTLRRLAPLGVCLLPLAILPFFRTAAGNTPARPPVPAKTEGFSGFAGSSSCSGRGCHGAISPNPGKGCLLNEASVWMRLDPHARAFEVLRSPRAVRMAKNLQIEHADKDSRCLACHSTPAFAADTSPEGRLLQSEGLGCETCHGPSRKGGQGWLTAHTTKDFARLSSADKKKLGMNDTSDLSMQAHMCVGCHVGSAPAPADGRPVAQDLNHDLMAAGHPRLTFDFATFKANLPPHWRPKTDEPGYSAKSWAVGRVVAAQASLDLLDFRAGDKKSPWPEFAESDCFACHASLRPERTDYRHLPQYRAPKHAPGSFPYCVWYSASLPDDGALRQEYTKLGALMSKATPDRDAVIKQAKVVQDHLKSLENKLAAMPFTQEQVREMMKKLAAADADRLAALSWDEAAQLVYSLAALYDSDRAYEGVNPGVKNERRTELFGGLYNELAFPPGYESPANFRQGGKVTDELRKLIQGVTK